MAFASLLGGLPAGAGGVSCLGRLRLQLAFLLLLLLLLLLSLFFFVFRFLLCLVAMLRKALRATRQPQLFAHPEQIKLFPPEVLRRLATIFLNLCILLRDLLVQVGSHIIRSPLDTSSKLPNSICGVFERPVCEDVDEILLVVRWRGRRFVHFSLRCGCLLSRLQFASFLQALLLPANCFLHRPVCVPEDCAGHLLYDLVEHALNNGFPAMGDPCRIHQEF
mmetsp:Transcript_20944/g.58086  ORF Transcript_20944/g.58086 Transcript_20944/m.58086 type:complete len:221 (-) Transcript_20944:1818-2480(-)